MNFSLLNTNLIYIILGASVGILGLILAIYGIATLLTQKTRLDNRMDRFIIPEPLESTEDSEKRIIPREIRGSLFNRTIKSGFDQLLAYLGRFTPEKLAVEIEHKLTIAGNPGNLHAGDFYALRFLLILVGIVLAFLANRNFSEINTTSIALGVMTIGLCYALPQAWLNRKAQARQDEIRRGLPDALDMLSVCASAGLGFDQSLQKVSGYWETELGHELKRTTQEMEMGVSRLEALRNLSERLEVDDLSRFVAIIVQAEKVGMSYADVLHSQALQLRIQRQYRAREIANKLPGKMILPMALFIFPAIIAVILGPSIPLIMNIF